ncbi:MAG: hypothetical protein ABI540_02415 [Spartobacteria bacterium]
MKHVPFCRRIILLSLLASCAFPRISSGQSSAADRARLLSSESTLQPPVSPVEDGVDQGYAAASPNDSDLGEQAILKRVEKYEPFTLETGVPIYYTSNVALVDSGKVGAAITAPVIGLTYAPRLQRTLYGEFTVRQQFFYYSNDLSSFNFASFDVLGGLVYYVPKLHNLVLRANLDFNRLTGTDDFDAFFSNLGLALGAEVPIPLGRAQQISLGAYANVSLYADPQPPRRNDFGLYAGYAVNLSRSFSLNASTTFVVRPYDSGGRTDVSEILALSANYRIRDWLTVSAISTFVANQSNQSVFDYQVINAGGGVTLSWKF